MFRSGQLEATFFNVLHAAANHFRFLGGEHGIIVSQTFRLDQYAARLLGKGNEIPIPDVEGCQELAGNHYLPPMPDTSDLFNCGALCLPYLQTI